jgi:alpha-beta hydrolase superfamily lysophospholipase/SAM-dependent methyltransferase
MKMTEHTVKSWDGVELFYRAWTPDKPTDKALLLFHRGHEHSGRWQEVVDLLSLPDLAVFAWDARGHGKSPGERGSAENLTVVVKDIDAFVRHVSRHHGIPTENMVVLAHSVGAVTVAAWVHDFAPRIRGMILGTPAFRVKLYLPFAIPLLRLKQKVFGPGYVKSYVKARVLTHDPEQARKYHADPAIFRQIAVNILLDLHDTSCRLIADAGAITVPTLMLTAGSDWVVRIGAQKKFFERLSSPVKEMETYPGLYHAIFHERDRQPVIDRVRKFVLDRFREDSAPSSLLKADQSGYTRSEFDRLSRPGSPHYGIIRLGMKIGGRLSRGIRLGWQDGFDSGVTLDYIYANRPQGTTPLGKFIDRQYLDTIGWRGIRQRKLNLERILRETIQKVSAAGAPVRILDIAAGAGRYVLETMREHPDKSITALLRDYKQANLDAATGLANEFGLKDRVTIVHGDAFDRSSLASVAPRPTIAIVSGLYELIPGNELVLNSLRGIADALEPGGWLIYTNQPWHPQVEFIARVLTNREGNPWIMRRRTQAEMDELTKAAGFEKTGMDIDPWGIFTVSSARRAAQ